MAILAGEPSFSVILSLLLERDQETGRLVPPLFRLKPMV